MRHDWTVEELTSICRMPLLELVFRAAGVHRQHHEPGEVQVCTLLSIKTGGCVEDCCYCSQSVHYSTGVGVQALMDATDVVRAAREARSAGSTRFCMGAAWREVRDNRDFERVLDMVSAVRDLGLEVCATLGMVTEEQAIRLREAGLHAYNHNVDTSEEFYGQVIHTRSYQDRLRTLQNARKAGLTVCSGGIIGMGESEEDRLNMLKTLANLDPHPESVPINALVPIEGTPLADRPSVETWEFIRMIATARIVMPQSNVRLSAGRLRMSHEAQALCFLAGANSIFAGEKLLTTPNPDVDQDKILFETLGLRAKKPRGEAVVS